MKNERLVTLGVIRFFGMILLDYLIKNRIYNLDALTFDGHGLSENELTLGLFYLSECGYKWGTNAEPL